MKWILFPFIIVFLFIIDGHINTYYLLTIPIPFSSPFFAPSSAQYSAPGTHSALGSPLTDVDVLWNMVMTTSKDINRGWRICFAPHTVCPINISHFIFAFAFAFVLLLLHVHVLCCMSCCSPPLGSHFPGNLAYWLTKWLPGLVPDVWPCQRSWKGFLCSHFPLASSVVFLFFTPGFPARRFSRFEFGCGRWTGVYFNCVDFVNDPFIMLLEGIIVLVIIATAIAMAVPLGL